MNTDQQNTPYIHSMPSVIISIVIAAAITVLCSQYTLAVIGLILMSLATGMTARCAVVLNHFWICGIVSLPAVLLCFFPTLMIAALPTALLPAIGSLILYFAAKRHIEKTPAIIAVTIANALVSFATYAILLIERFGSIPSNILQIILTESTEQLTGILANYELDFSIVESMMRMALMLIPGVIMAVSAVFSMLTVTVYFWASRRREQCHPLLKLHPISGFVYLLLFVVALLFTVNTVIGLAAINLIIAMLPILFVYGCKSYFFNPITKKILVIPIIVSIALCLFNPIILQILISLHGAIQAIAIYFRSKAAQNNSDPR